MQNSRNHLLLLLGLAAPLVTATFLQTAARNVSTPTTLVTVSSAHLANTEPVTDGDVILTAANYLATSTTSNTTSTALDTISTASDTTPTTSDITSTTVNTTPTTSGTTSTTSDATVSASPTATQFLGHGGFKQSPALNVTTSTTLGHKMVANRTDAQSVTDSDIILTAPIHLATSATFNTTKSANSTAIQSATDSNLTSTTATNLATPTTFNTTISANPTYTQSQEAVESQSTFNPIPPSSPPLSIISNYKVPTPTPGSVAILNGIPTRVLDDTLEQDSIPIEADRPGPENYNINTTNLYQPWNTSYPGPIHDDDWVKYLQIWDPVWWSTNLDSLRQTSCLCSHEDFLTNPLATLAAYMNFEYYSHTTGALYNFDWVCGPATSSMTLKQRITSAKGKSEHCWQAAGGEFAGDKPYFERIKGYYCDPTLEFCVEPWKESDRSFIFRHVKRNYDRHGVHTWSEIQPVVADVCEPKCRGLFKMRFDDMNLHNPSFVTTFYPPKPVNFEFDRKVGED